MKAVAQDVTISDHRLITLEVLPVGHSGGLAAPQAPPGHTWPWPHRVPPVIASKSGAWRGACSVGRC
eukprot:12276709-Alexandrium_andersonii.AAC.1